MILPTIASVPLLAIYSGGTTILLPIPLRAMLGSTMDLRNFAPMSIFITDIIQTMFTICTWECSLYSVLTPLTSTLDLMDLKLANLSSSDAVYCYTTHSYNHFTLNVLTNSQEMYLSEDTQIITFHAYSVVMIVPFIITSLALFKYNK